MAIAVETGGPAGDTERRDREAVRSVVAALSHWAAAPADPDRVLLPSGRTDPTGVLEADVAAAQIRVREVLERQRHLAEVGLAVSKISHDMKGVLAAARLLADRLPEEGDPDLRKVASRLRSVLDRAIGLSEAVLAHGRSEPPVPARRSVALAALVDEAAGLAGLGTRPHIVWQNAIRRDLRADVDPDQLLRALVNLIRNAIEALEAGPAGAPPCIAVTGRRLGFSVRLRIGDNGPGLPILARMNLFRPFLGAARPGGCGLGLPIAAEIVRAHGGTIRALRNGVGTAFLIEIPDRVLVAAGPHPAPVADRRPVRAALRD
jgi:signal transduction histidine kinase